MMFLLSSFLTALVASSVIRTGLVEIISSPGTWLR